MSTVKSKNLQVGTDATASNNFTIYQPSTPDGTLRVGVGNADSPTEVGRFTSAGYKPATAPAFYAYQTTQQTGVVNTVFTKVNLQTEEFDLTNDFDTSLSRFTPSVAGYYYMCAKVEGGTNPTGQGTSILSIYKNGSRYREGVLNINNTNSRQFPHVAGVCYANGTTDYFELYIYADGMPATWSLSAGAEGFRKYFCASLIQQA
jgi:hypothetical protein